MDKNSLEKKGVKDRRSERKRGSEKEPKKKAVTFKRYLTNGL